jgi:Lrp/AsnC family leucine-responsive transcriptional regulator
MIDEIDRNILKILQEDARTTNAEIARSVGLAQSATLERLRKLQDRGIVRGYHAVVDPKAVGLGLLAFVMVRADGNDARETADALGRIAGVLEVHNVAGEDCYIVKIRAADPEDLGRLLREQVRRVPSVTGTRTTIVLETTKDTTALPLDGAAEGD